MLTMDAVRSLILRYIGGSRIRGAGPQLVARGRQVIVKALPLQSLISRLSSVAGSLDQIRSTFLQNPLESILGDVSGALGSITDSIGLPSLSLPDVDISDLAGSLGLNISSIAEIGDLDLDGLISLNAADLLPSSVSDVVSATRFLRERAGLDSFADLPSLSVGQLEAILTDNIDAPPVVVNLVQAARAGRVVALSELVELEDDQTITELSQLTSTQLETVIDAPEIDTETRTMARRELIAQEVAATAEAVQLFATHTAVLSGTDVPNLFADLEAGYQEAVLSAAAAQTYMISAQTAANTAIGAYANAIIEIGTIANAAFQAANNANTFQAQAQTFSIQSSQSAANASSSAAAANISAGLAAGSAIDANTHANSAFTYSVIANTHANSSGVSAAAAAASALAANISFAGAQSAAIAANASAVSANSSAASANASSILSADYASNAAANATSAAANATFAQQMAANASANAASASASAVLAAHYMANAAANAASANASAVSANASAVSANSSMASANASQILAADYAANAAANATAAAANATFAQQMAANASANAASANASSILSASYSESSRYTAAMLLPNNFIDEGLHWKSGHTGPNSLSSFPVSGLSPTYPSVTGYGKVIQITSGPSADISTQGYIKAIAGRRYKVTTVSRITAAGTGTNLFAAFAIGTDEAGTYQSPSYVYQASANNPSGWVTTTVEFVADTLIADGGTHIRPMLRAECGSGTMTYQVSSITIEDITESYFSYTNAIAANASAVSANSSAASASANATLSAQWAANAAANATTAANHAANAAANATFAQQMAANASANAASASANATLSAQWAANSAANAATAANHAANAAANAASALTYRNDAAANATAAAANAVSANSSAAAASANASLAATFSYASRTTASSILPSDISNPHLWIRGIVDDPTSNTAASPGTFMANSTGAFIRVNNISAGSYHHIRTRGLIPAIPGRRYRIEARAVQNTDPVGGSTLFTVAAYGVLGDYSDLTYSGYFENVTGTTSEAALTTSDGIVTLALEGTVTASPGVPWIAPSVYFYNATHATGITDVLSYKVTDITDSYHSYTNAVAANASAVAANSSAASASANATLSAQWAANAAANAATAANHAANAAANATFAQQMAANASANAASASANATLSAQWAANSAANAATAADHAANAAANAASALTYRNDAAANATAAAANAVSANNSAAAASANATLSATFATSSRNAAAAVFPTDFTQDGRFWTGLYGEPTTAPNVESTYPAITYPTTAEGKTLRVAAAMTGYIHVRTRNVLPTTPGRRYKFTARVRQTANPVSGSCYVAVYPYGLDSTYAVDSAPTSWMDTFTGTNEKAALVTGDGIVTLAWESTVKASPTVPWIAPQVYFYNGGASVGAPEVLSFVAEDVTESYFSYTNAVAANASAVAANSSAASASANATLSAQWAANAAANAATAANHAANAAANATFAQQMAANASANAASASASSSLAANYAANAAANATAAAANASSAAASATAAAANAVSANSSAAAANASAVLSASINSGSLNPDPMFTQWANGTHTSVWADAYRTGGATTTRIAGDSGYGYSAQMYCPASGQAELSLADTTASPGWYVVEVDVDFVSGNWQAAGTRFYTYTAGFASTLVSDFITFATDIPVGHNAPVGNTPAAGRYRFRKLVHSPLPTTAAYYVGVYGGGVVTAKTVAGTINVRRFSVRLANNAEVDGYQSLAEVKTLSGAVADIAGRQSAFWTTQAAANGSNATSFISVRADSSTPAAAPLTMLGGTNAGTFSTIGRVFQKIGGSNASWTTGGGWSQETYTSTAYVSAQILNNADYVMFGLTDDTPSYPTDVGIDYTALDYAIYCAGGAIEARELGTGTSLLASSLPTDTFSIEYNGSSGGTIIYKKNGVALRTVTSVGTGRTFRLGVSIYDIGDGIKNVVFGSAPPSSSSSIAMGAQEIVLTNTVGDATRIALRLVGGDAAFGGNIYAGGKIIQGNGNQGWEVAVKPKIFQVKDGDTPTWSNLGYTPNYTLSPVGLAPLSTGETYNLYLDSLTSTGATVRLKINVPGTPSSYNLTTDSAGGGGDPDRVIDKGSDPDATGGSYSYSGTYSATGPLIFEGPGFYTYSVDVQIALYAKIGGTWTVVGYYYETVSGSQGTGGTKTVTGSFSIGVTAGSGVTHFGADGELTTTVTDLSSVAWSSPGSGSGTRTASPANETCQLTIIP